MSRLDSMIQELCQDGVEYKTLDDLFVLKNGYTPSKKNDEYWRNGTVPWFRLEDIRTNGRVLSDAKQHVTSKAVKGSLFPANSIIVSTTATIGEHALIESPFLINQQLTCVSVKEQFKAQINIKFVFYYFEILKEDLKRIASQSGNMPIVSLAKMKQLLMPLPPLEVQEEIVRLLDDFTAKTAELQAELNKEYEARKKQYEYYRDSLLTKNEQIPRVKLCDIATSLYRGAGIKRNQVTEKGIPCVRYGEIYTTYDTCFNDCVSHTDEKYLASPKFFEHGDILFAITGESVEDIAKSIAYLGHDKCLAGGDIVVMKHNQNPRYLAHVLSTGMARAQKSKGKVKNKVVHSSVPSIKQIEIPLPSLDDQKKYADILDGFYLALNRLQSELPAEIESRQKQYEYYRDKLLTFKELNESEVN